MIPLVGLSGAFDAAGLWQNLATMFGAAAVYAQRRALPHRDPVDELCYRLRNPIKHALAHPLVTIRRKVDRRRST